MSGFFWSPNYTCPFCKQVYNPSEGPLCDCAHEVAEMEKTMEEERNKLIQDEN